MLPFCKCLKSLVLILKSYKVVAIVDPPRAGLSEKAIQQLRSSRVQKLIFVSSDPKATIRCKAPNFLESSPRLRKLLYDSKDPIHSQKLCGPWSSNIRKFRRGSFPTNSDPASGLVPPHHPLHDRAAHAEDLPGPLQPLQPLPLLVTLPSIQ